MKRVFIVEQAPHITMFELFGLLSRLGIADIMSTHTAADYFHKYKPKEYTFIREFYDRRKDTEP